MKPETATYDKFALLFVFVATNILIALATLNVFYGSGDFTDGGWLATVAWHKDWQLMGPPAFNQSFFNEHVSPIFWLTNIASWILPFSKFDFCALWFGACYGIFAAGVYYAWRMNDDKDASWSYAIPVAIAVALAAAFSGVGMQGVRLPHHEMAIPGLVLWFFIRLGEKNYRAAGWWLAISLAVREDVGFHIFGLVFLLQMAAKIFRLNIPQSKWLWRFALAGFVYSSCVMLLKAGLSINDSVFIRSYVGTPPWQHVTAELMAKRWHTYVTERTYIYVPFFVTLVWAAVVRNPLLPIGYLAFVPWIVISFFGTNECTSVLAYYYGFPYWISLAWPLVAMKFAPAMPALKRWPYALVLLSSLMFWDDGQIEVYPLTANAFLESPFLPSWNLQHRKSQQEFVDYFVKNQKLFEAGTMGIDMAMQALLIDYVDRHTWMAELDDQNIHPDIIIYYENGLEWISRVSPMVSTAEYKYFYKVPGTRIRLAAKNDLETALPPPRPFVSVTGTKLFN